VSRSIVASGDSRADHSRIYIGNIIVELSSRAEYALLALLEMASSYQQKKPLTVAEITAKQAIPDRYLEQILSSLRRNGIIQSQRGAKGGYLLSREPWQITLLEIIAVAEGERSESTASAASTVEKKLIDEVWQQAKTACQAVLDHYTLADLCQRRDAYVQVNPMYYI
jgi:Rrf2 family protein